MQLEDYFNFLAPDDIRIKGSRSSISRADTLEDMGAFWDVHDFTEYDTDAPDVQFEITCAVPVEPDLLSAVEQQAHRRGISVETLVNLWLQQRLFQTSAAS